MAQIMFESINVPGLCIANSAALALYAAGRTTGVVLESGDGVTHAVPVLEGHVLEYATTRLDLGGRDLTEYLLRLLSEQGYSLAGLSEKTAHDIKERMCYVAGDLEQEVQILSNTPELSYVLPDGTLINAGKSRVQCPEALFQPSLLGLESAGIHELVRDAIMKCHVDIRGAMFNDIVLAGGSTMFRGIKDRLQNELTALAPSGPRIRIIAQPNRAVSTWVGGSILASLSSFRDMCVSRKEYDEYGPLIVHSKMRLKAD